MMDPRFALILRGVETKRFHTVATIRNETVGHHQGVVMALLAIAYPSVGSNVWTYAALHDLAEHETGDTPSPTKRASPEVKSVLDALESSVFRQATINIPALDRFETHVFKRCDNVAGMMSCWREYMMGNVQILEQFTNFRNYYTQQRDSALLELTHPDFRDFWAPYTLGNFTLDRLVSDMDLQLGGRGYPEWWTPPIAQHMEERETGILPL